MAVSIPTTRIISGRESNLVVTQCQIDIGYGVPQIPDDGYKIVGGYGWGWDAVTNFNYEHGGRWVLPSTFDFSAHEFLSWNFYTRLYGYTSFIKTHDEGGMVLLIIDSAGNYKGWNVYGSDIENYSPGGSNSQGWFNSYQSGDATVDFMLKLDTQPEYQSSTLPTMNDIVAVEIHVNPKTSAGNRGWELYLNDLQLIDTPTATGPFVFQDVTDEYTSMTRYTNSSEDFRIWNGQIVNPTKLSSSYQTAIFPKVGLNLGDGSTETTASIEDVSVGLWNLHQDSPAFATVGRVIIIDTPRLHRINQSATDNINLKSYTFTSSSQVGFICEGDPNGTLVLENCLIARSDLTQLGHGSYTDTQFVDSKTPVEVTDLTSLSGCVFRDGDYGIKLLAGPGNYSSLGMRFGGISIHDIEIGSGGAGSYDLSGVSLSDGDTLKIHNDSVNDIEVILPPGMTYSTTSDGGAISVVSPPTTYTIEAPNILELSRVQIVNVTTDAEIANIVVGSVNLSYTMESGVHYTPGDLGRVRVTFVDGVTAMEPIEVEFVFPSNTTINTIPSVQEPALNYNAYGVDGSTIDEFSWDSGNVEVDISDSDNSTSVQRFAAWWYYFITTEVGVDEAFGAVTWESLNSVKLNSNKMNLELDNVKPVPLILVGGRMYHSDGTTIISPTSNSIHVDYSPVYSIETGVSGLTASESNKLDAISTIPNDVWSQPSRTLTSVDKNGYTLTQTEKDSITSGVWTETDRTLTVDAGITAQDKTDIANQVWSVTSRTLTTPTGISASDKSDIVDQVWAATTRSLTTPTGVSETDKSDIADQVWAVTTRTLTTPTGVSESDKVDLVDRVWSATSRTLTAFDKAGYSLTTGAETSLVNAIWAATTRTLTEFDKVGYELSTGDKALLSDAIWSATTRSLTTPTGVSESDKTDIVDQVWTAASRTLTAFDKAGYELTPTQLSDIISGVWGHLNRTLTSIDKTGYSLTTSDKTDIAGQVWLSASRTLTSIDKTGYELTAQQLADISTQVWSEASRTLTAFDKAGYELSVADKTDIVSQVWGATTRSLTEFDKVGYELSAGDKSALVTLIWSAVSRSLTTPTGVSEADKVDISNQVWSVASRTLTSVDKSGYELLSTQVQEIVDQVWAAATRTLTAVDKAGYELTASQLDGLVTQIWSAVNRTLTGAVAVDEQSKDDIVDKTWEFDI